jgi:hypothetical protein
MTTFSNISSHGLAAVTGGLGVGEALGNAAGNVREWGRVVYGRQSELNKFIKQKDMTVPTYSDNLRRFDANYKPVIPTEFKW